ncbi:MAG: carbohydrate-binding family 9-like protein [Flavobacteriaceae bacterium]
MNHLIKIAFSFLIMSCNSADHSFLRIRKMDTPPALSFSALSQHLESKTKKVTVRNANWEAFPYTPEVAFRMAHDTDHIYLKFYVSEAHILAQHNAPNTATHRDSCVEFFIDPDQSGGYYNFEFNCIGTTHLAYGPDRYSRTFIDPEKITSSLFIESTLGNQPFEEKTGDFHWEMVVAIPSSLFIYHPNLKFDKLESKANFFKCGDDTQKPHFLSWQPIDTPKPDFHRPEFFGNLMFD